MLHHLIICLFFIGSTSVCSVGCDQELLESDQRTELPQGLKYLCFLSESLVDKSGLLAKVRFQGPFGKENQDYLCHYTIIKPPLNLPSTADRDSPQSYTSSLLQQFFPSPTGGRLVLPGNRDDLMSALNKKHIHILLKTFVHLKEKGISWQEAVIEFEKSFKSLNIDKNQLKKTNQLWPKEKRRENAAALLKDYINMFAGALFELDRYPHNFVESVILSFALKNNLLEIGDGQKLLSQDSYIDWKKSAFIDQELSFDAFSKLLDDPMQLIAVTLACDQYDSLYPKMMGASGASYTYVDDNGVIQKIPDYGNCGGASLRSFLNLVMADTKTRTFNTGYLRKAFPNACAKLFFFIDGDPENTTAFKQFSYDDINDDIEGQTAFGNIISDLNRRKVDEEAKDVVVKYCIADRCSLDVGFDNMLVVLEKVLNDPVLSVLRRGIENEDQRRAEMVSYILQKFSRDDFHLSWHVNGNHEALGNFQSLTIAINGQDLFTWYISAGHFDFYMIPECRNEDWRKNPQVLEMLMTHPMLDPILKGYLIPFYLANTNSFYLVNTNASILLSDKVRDEAEKYANEIFFGSLKSHVEQKRRPLIWDWA